MGNVTSHRGVKSREGLKRRKRVKDPDTKGGKNHTHLPNGEERMGEDDAQWGAGPFRSLGEALRGRERKAVGRIHLGGDRGEGRWLDCDLANQANGKGTIKQQKTKGEGGGTAIEEGENVC